MLASLGTLLGTGIGGVVGLLSSIRGAQSSNVARLVLWAFCGSLVGALVGTVLRGIGDGIVSGRRGSGFRGTCWLKRGSNFVSSGSNIQTMTSP